MPSHSIVFWGSSVQNLQKVLIQLPTDSIPLPATHTHTHTHTHTSLSVRTKILESYYLKLQQRETANLSQKSGLDFQEIIPDV